MAWELRNDLGDVVVRAETEGQAWIRLLRMAGKLIDGRFFILLVAEMRDFGYWAEEVQGP